MTGGKEIVSVYGTHLSHERVLRRTLHLMQRNSAFQVVYIACTLFNVARQASTSTCSCCLAAEYACPPKTVATLTAMLTLSSHY